ncbi:hypothetical protein FRC03_006882 [Tulasnella sp. 419]|nr:hypothetical protein FRC03_006882 [Tulasnella sp. 419]
MSPPLLAILLVASSSTGSNLVFCWPPKPTPPVRLGRPRPLEWEKLSDVSWRAAHDFDRTVSSLSPEEQDAVRTTLVEHLDQYAGDEYNWKRPGSGDPDLFAYHTSASTSRPPSGTVTPPYFPANSAPSLIQDTSVFSHMLGYSSTMLAEILSPKQALCHQKFELFVDELAFIGHPVHIGKDGTWGWSEVYDTPTLNPFGDKDHRGRSLGRETSPYLSELILSPDALRSELPQSRPPPIRPLKRPSDSIRSFHLVLVLDRPDPSFVASSNIFKFVDVYYKQIAFKLTAAMHHEQGRVDFITHETNTLLTSREACITSSAYTNNHALAFIDVDICSDAPLSSYIEQSLEKSTLAATIRTVYEAITNDSIANVLINDIPVHIQLPPNHNAQLCDDFENDEDQEYLTQLLLDETEQDEHDAEGRWYDEIQYGWRLPPLLPWKTIILTNNDDPIAGLWTGQARAETGDEKTPEELLRRFVGMLSPSLSFSDIAVLLDLDLEAEVYPMARLLVYNRKAKIIDVIPSSLKNVYVPAQRISKPISEFATSFAKAFPNNLPALPVLLSSISTSQRAFATIVPDVEQLSPYTDVLVWLLRHDLVNMLHVRIRIIVTTGIKSRVKERKIKEREERRAKKREESRKRRAAASGMNQSGEKADNENENKNSEDNGSDEENSDEQPFVPPIDGIWESSSPEDTLNPRRRSRGRQFQSKLSDNVWDASWLKDDEDEHEEEREIEDSDWDGTDNVNESSFIFDPGRANPLERSWLEAMSEGKSDSIKERFERLCPYFDGKKTTDELLFRTELSRRQLREVLHHYSDFLITLLHP